MNRVVADAHAAAFNRMMSHTERDGESALSNRKALSDSTRAIAGSTERVRGRDGYAAFYSKTKKKTIHSFLYIKDLVIVRAQSGILMISSQLRPVER